MLTIHRSERADALIGPLAGLLSDAPPDPFTPDVIAVPSRGVERWVMQQLSIHLGAAGARDGIAANILFPSPAQLVGDVMSTLADLGADADPWTGGRFVWSVLAVMDECVGEPWCAMLAHHLGLDDAAESHRQGRRYSTAVTLARLFASYGESRPSMIADWAASEDTDGHGSPLAEDMVWQATLWRRLRERIEEPSPAERLPGACATLLEQPELVDLPVRLSVFGPTRLSRTHLAVLEALAAHRDVYLWLTHPSPMMWDGLRELEPVTRRCDDHTALILANPLLASLSRDVREMEQLLPADAVDIHHEVAHSSSSVLSRIQDDIRHGRDSAASQPLRLDGSVAIHSCHGQVRQVEVLRESLLHLFNDDPTLQPRDVIVLCPDVDTFAPLIAAAFGQTDAPHLGHRLRVRLADRGPARTNRLLETLQTLLGLADARVTASEVLDLIAREPVARRFGFSGDDLETTRRWVADGGARWGIGPHQRQLFGLTDIRQNTFCTARDRVLLGVTADESDLAWLGVALPLDDVASSDVDLAGRFAEFIDRLNAVLIRLGGPHHAQTWSERLEEALELLTEVGEPEAWQRTQAGRRLGEATGHAGEASLSLADMRALFADEFRARPTRSNFRTGEITVATLVPMRFVPHRVVAIIGLDDEAFPRVTSIQGDDILALDPCLGERDPRSEDRQLLLDALMSATDHVIICYTGADPVTGTRRPPSAPLADVIDIVTATVETGAPVVTPQPLQPFDDANFVAPQPFSFDQQAYLAAEATRRGQQPTPAFLPAPLGATPGDEVALDDLVAFLVNPTRAFLRQRLGVTIPRTPDDVADALPLSLAGLARWDVGERLLAEVLSGATVEASCQAELRRGTLPPGRLGLADVDEIGQTVALMAGAVAAHAGDSEQTSIDVALSLGAHRLSGTVTGVYGTTLVAASFSKLAPKHRIAAWVRLLALCAANGADSSAVVIGRAENDRRAAKYAALTAPPEPARLLAQLLDLRAAGMREPLPLAPETSCAYAARRLSFSPDDAYDLAKGAWTSSSGGKFRTFRENDDAAICCVYGPDAPFSVVWDEPAPEGERWFDDEPNRFAQLALRVWGPLIEHERIHRVR
jgi:exodeoxyribonuclease V gamma subunit